MTDCAVCREQLDEAHALLSRWRTAATKRQTNYGTLSLAQLVVETDHALAGVEKDPTPWCTYCGARRKADCHCGPLADND